MLWLVLYLGILFNGSRAAVFEETDIVKLDTCIIYVGECF